MPADMTFGVLGPLTLQVDGVEVPVPPGKQRILLAGLLLRSGRTVTADQLAEMLWGPVRPRQATVISQNYVMRLRRALGRGGDRIATRPGGYLMRVDPGEFDVTAVEEALAAAHRSAQSGAWSETAAHACAALALWRGEPLCDIDSDVLTAEEIPRLTELWFTARELRVEAGLQLGEHTEIVAQARQLAADVPLREHTQALLMRVLDKCGRRAEALQVYLDARSMLVEELGCEPGPELQAVHSEILAGNSGRGASPSGSAEPAGGPAFPVPRQLPPAVARFTGRGTELAALDALLAAPAPGTPLAMLITAIGGTAGVGKTALAVHWAHRAGWRFPGGQLYVNLRGYDLDEPVTAGDALAGFLRALGVPGEQIPDEPEERARLYRSKLAGRHVLVVLDNARDGEQVRALLPGDPGCLTVVTSRDQLAGLVATAGARRLDLSLLPLADAVGLLRSLIGRRIDDDPEAAEELAGLCARLPLALRIAAELAAARPGSPMADLVTELAAGRLDGLDAGEDRADVRAVFSWSVRQLPDDVAETFALIGLHPGQDLDPHAAAALVGTPAGHARRVLVRLQRASLLQAAGPGRYGMHDLMRAYAREQAAARYGDALCRQALTQLFDYYVGAAAAAMNTLFPAEAHRRPQIPASASALPEMQTEADARAWLDAERANLVAVTTHCAGHGWPHQVADLAGILFRYLVQGGHVLEAQTIFGHALLAAGRSGDLTAEAVARNGLGGVEMRKGHFHSAVGHYLAALELFRRLRDRAGEARVLYNLGSIEHELHNLELAADYYRQASAAYQDGGDSLGVPRALSALSGVEIEMGNYDQAAENLQVALKVFRAEDDQTHEAHALSGIGEISLARSQLTEAAGFFEQALTIYRSLGDQVGATAQMLNLGDVSLRQGNCRLAISRFEQALAEVREAGYEYGEVRMLRKLAEARHAAGQDAEARTELETAIRLAGATGNTYQQASGYRDLAESHYSAAEDEEAVRHWQRALDLYDQLNAAEADEVRARLTACQARKSPRSSL
jgi:DNA-binding SARP family transcriptional activator/tetratricopeptide (TPR) repeat protein